MRGPRLACERGFGEWPEVTTANEKLVFALPQELRPRHERRREARRGAARPGRIGAND